MAATLFDKIWDPHVVADLGAGWSLLYCDRVLVHDLSGGRALQEVGERRLRRGAPRPGVRDARPRCLLRAGAHLGDLPDRRDACSRGLRKRAARDRRAAVRPRPGRQRHRPCHGRRNSASCCRAPRWSAATATPAPMAASARWPSASARRELKHVLATQTLPQRKPQHHAHPLRGRAPPGVTPKDMILAAIGRFGAAAGTGYAVEYAGIGGARAVGRGAADAVQPVHRDGRQDGHGRAGRDHLRNGSHGRDFAPEGRGLGRGGRGLARAAVG